MSITAPKFAFNINQAPIAATYVGEPVHIIEIITRMTLMDPPPATNASTIYAVFAYDNTGAFGVDNLFQFTILDTP